MRTLYINKMQYFVVLSIFFHLLLFVALSGFAKLNKEHQELEIFIINEMTRKEPARASTLSSKENYVKEKHSVVKPAEKPSSEQKTEQTTVNYPALSHQTVEFDSSEKTSSSRVTSSSTTEKTSIIDAEFGTAYGPKFVYREIPVYPQIARRLGKEGKVVLRLTLNEKGELVNIEVIEGAPYGFTESAIEAVKKSRFSPAIKNGKPIACRAILPVRFVLKN